MRPHSDYVLVGRRAALDRDFAAMLDDLRSALHRLDRQPKDLATRPRDALSSEVGTGSRKDNASKQQTLAQSRDPK
jgi:ribonuclease P protein component